MDYYNCTLLQQVLFAVTICTAVLSKLMLFYILKNTNMFMTAEYDVQLKEQMLMRKEDKEQMLMTKEDG